MAVTWVEEFVGSDVRIVGHIAEKPRVGHSALRYSVEKNDEITQGPFATFDEAMKVAEAIATDIQVRSAA